MTASCLEIIALCTYPEKAEELSVWNVYGNQSNKTNEIVNPHNSCNDDIKTMTYVCSRNVNCLFPILNIRVLFFLSKTCWLHVQF